MSATRGRAIAILVALAALTACGRHVVVDPQTAARANDHDWRITGEPERATLPAGASTASTPPATVAP